MGDTIDAQLAKVVERELRPALVEGARGRQPPPRRDDFDVEQVWGDESFALKAIARPVTVVPIVGQCRDDHAGVDDDHLPSRSARTASTADANDARPPARPPARWRTSSSVGVVASSVSNSSKYSCNDLPSDAAATTQRRVDLAGYVLDLNARHDGIVAPM